MISVKNLKKNFGPTRAVDDVTFEIPQGQVVGFLGPNGAGKTTTMRLLTGFLTPDEGEATLMGEDIYADSLSIRRNLGYLPENNPLPDDLETTDYLHYIGRLRGLRNCEDRFQKVKTVIERCALGQAVGKKLFELSKGYRQRVGLAQSIIHDPDILILDEPTSGLDPNQVQDVRDLIQDLKKEKTLLVSTHILSEVQNTCDRVIIINRGRLVADGSPDVLKARSGGGRRYKASLKGDAGKVKSLLQGLPGVLSVREGSVNGAGEDQFIIETEAGGDPRPALFEAAVQNQLPILSLEPERVDLESIFRSLTKEGKT